VSTDNKIAEQGTEKKPAGEPAEEIMTNWELAATEPLAPEKGFRWLTSVCVRRLSTICGLVVLLT
jgi:hypothetical protein